jgi:hypothetical protein
MLSLSASHAPTPALQRRCLSYTDIASGLLQSGGEQLTTDFPVAIYPFYWPSDAPRFTMLAGVHSQYYDGSRLVLSLQHCKRGCRGRCHRLPQLQTTPSTVALLAGLPPSCLGCGLDGPECCKILRKGASAAALHSPCICAEPRCPAAV